MTVGIMISMVIGSDTAAIMVYNITPSRRILYRLE